MIERRRLGSSELLISPIGLGTAQFGGAGWLNTWGPPDDRTSIATIRQAVASGINWLDTAPIYGQGHAEKVIGRALQEMAVGERPLVFTKCGLEWAPRQVGPSKRRLTPASVRAEVELSLSRLAVDRIDLYQVHYPPEEEAASLPDAWGEMALLVEEGKVAAVGLCNAGVSDLDLCHRIRPVDSVQSPLSLLRQAADAEMLPWVKQNGSGFIGYRALESGLLTSRATLRSGTLWYRSRASYRSRCRRSPWPG
jgi:aryl-alcohol dehydrogenase-like predicted oxidoreductase